MHRPVIALRAVIGTDKGRTSPDEDLGKRARKAALALAAVLCLLYAWPAVAQTTSQPDLVRAIEAYDQGDLQRSLELLQSVPALLNTHDSAVRSLYLGLVYFALGDRARATESFMRAVRVEPPLRLDPTVHSPARVQAFEEARKRVLDEWRAAAVEADAAGNEIESLRLWQTVLAAEPEDQEANTRVVAIREAQRIRTDSLARARMDSLAGAGIRRPQEDPTPATAGGSTTRYNPGQAFAMGMLVPGLGEFYTGRALRGVLALAGAGGALAAGYLSERQNINCRTEPVNNVCPPEDILDTDTERPYLPAAIAAAVGITLIGAIDALLAARRSNAAAERATGSDASDTGVRLLAPNLRAHGDQVRAEILRLRFR